MAIMLSLHVLSERVIDVCVYTAIGGPRAQYKYLHMKFVALDIHSIHLAASCDLNLSLSVAFSFFRLFWLRSRVARLLRHFSPPSPRTVPPFTAIFSVSLLDFTGSQGACI